MEKVKVLKFGGSSLQTPEMIKQAAIQIKQLDDQGNKVIVVVSAMGETTNELINLADKITKAPNRREMDMLISAGERISMALMSMALHELGCDAISFTGSQAGILTCSNHNEAEILELKPIRVEESLKQNKIVIVAGFQGVDPDSHEVTTLGRGGSDITAVAFANHFNADECIFLKDVQGLQSCDPKKVSNTTHIESISFDKLHTLCKWGSKILHPRSVEYAQAKNVNLKIMHSSNEQSKSTSVNATSSCSAKALSSLTPVFKFDLKSDLPTWLVEFTNKHNLPYPNMVHQDNGSTYLAAPTDLISTYRTFLTSEFELSEFSVVTVVGKTTTVKDIKKADHIFKSKHSLHIFLNIDDENETLSRLHKQLS